MVISPNLQDIQMGVVNQIVGTFSSFLLNLYNELQPLASRKTYKYLCDHHFQSVAHLTSPQKTWIQALYNTQTFFGLVQDNWFSSHSARVHAGTKGNFSSRCTRVAMFLFHQKTIFLFISDYSFLRLFLSPQGTGPS